MNASSRTTTPTRRSPFIGSRKTSSIVANEANSRRNDGFTLLELLVVVAIIALLAGYVGPRYFAQLGKSQSKVALSQIQAFGKALDQYRLDVGHYPTSDQGLPALLKNPSGESRWQGPYLQKDVPPDPWGHAYDYKMPGTNGKDYDITSYGKDGRVGGIDEAADVVN